MSVGILHGVKFQLVPGEHPYPLAFRLYRRLRVTHTHPTHARVSTWILTVTSHHRPACLA